jgi:predicted transcriptional regulator
MRPDRSLFDTADAQAERDADARAEESAQAGRTVSHGAVRLWLESWGSAKRLPRPRIGD